MELNPKQQLIELIKSSQRILLLSHRDPDGDAIASLVAFSLILKKLKKDVTAAYSGLLSPNLNFLPIENITQNFSPTKDFIIHIDLSKSGIEKISYLESEQGAQRMSLIITPEKGKLVPRDVSFEEGRLKYDLIISLDCSNLERIGKIYEENRELFSEAPVVNIDHHITNEQYGKVNLVDMNATSTAEILVSVAESLSREKNLLDPTIATCLLTGLITDTDSFQNDNTTPKSFTVAAQLVAAGAKQQDIIRNIYKNKSLVILRVWGVVLSNLVEEKEAGFVWTIIRQKEFRQCNADSTATEGVNNELLRTVPEVKFSLLLTEKEDGKVYGSLRSVDSDFNVTDIAKLFGGGGHTKAAGFTLEGDNIEQDIAKAILKIKNFLINKQDNVEKPPIGEV